MTLRVGDVIKGAGVKSQKRAVVLRRWMGNVRWWVDLQPLGTTRHALKSITRPINPETGLPDGYVKEGEG